MRPRRYNCNFTCKTDITPSHLYNPASVLAGGTISVWTLFRRNYIVPNGGRPNCVKCYHWNSFLNITLNIHYQWQIWNVWKAPLGWRHNGRDSVSNHQPHHCLLNRLFRRRSKKTSKLRVTGLCVGNSPGTGEFPTQMASNAENVSIWWRHHDNGNSYIWHLDLLKMACHQLQTSIVTLMQLSRAVLWTKIATCNILY